MTTDIDKKKKILKLYLEYKKELEDNENRATELLKSLKNMNKVSKESASQK